MAQNSTIIFATNIPLDKGYKNVVNYNTTQMLAKLRSQEHLVAEISNYSFIKKEGKRIIKTSLSFAVAQTVNYIAFRNDSYYAKWYFAFVNSVEFVSPACTEIEFTIDEWTTWFEQFEQKSCYILREHVNDDGIGANTVPENLQVPDVTCINTSSDLSLSDYSWICVLSAWQPDSKTGYNGIAVYNGSIYGKLALLFQNNLNGWKDLLLYILQTNADGHIADMTDMFIVPSALVEQSQLTVHEFTCDPSVGGETGRYFTMQFSDTAKTFQILQDKPYNWRHYIPKNKKLYTYPYNYLLVTNNNGNQNIYKYEDFSTGNFGFDIDLNFSIGGSGKAVPIHYKGMAKNDDEGIPLGKYPTCGWSADSFTNWLTQQAVNVPMQFLNLMTSNFRHNIEGVSSYAQKIGSVIGEFYQASLLPEIQGGGNTADVVFTSKRNSFYFRQMTAKPEFLAIIDDYFTRFGYAINRLLVPNMTGRENWNYVEIAEGEVWIEGPIPAKSKEIINNIARAGVTIWHNLDNIGNYNLSNNII